MLSPICNTPVLLKRWKLLWYVKFHLISWMIYLAKCRNFRQQIMRLMSSEIKSDQRNVFYYLSKMNAEERLAAFIQ